MLHVVDELNCVRQKHNKHKINITKTQMTSDTNSSKVQSTLKKYLRTNALRESPKDTFVAYLGKNSTDADHEAFLEYIESEYLANSCRKMEQQAASKVGVYSLLDGMPSSSKGRPPSLNALLDEDAYQGGNTATFDHYLGDNRTREEEQEFRQRLAFVRDIFDSPLNESQAQAVAEYMLGPVKQVSDDEESESEESEEEPSEEEEEEESEDDDDRRKRSRRSEKSSQSKPSSSSHHHRSDRKSDHSSRKKPRDSRYY